MTRKLSVNLPAALRSLCSMALSIAAFSVYGSAQTTARISAPVDGTDVVRLTRTVHPAISVAQDFGRVNPDLPVQRIVLRLKPSDAQAKDLAKFINDLHDKNSPDYRRWLTPEGFAKRFAPADDDIEKVTGWLRSSGFQGVKIARGKQWVEFSGSSAQVESAFRTEMHNYVVNGETHIANSSDISIPRALAPVVGGVLSLHDFHGHPLHTPLRHATRDPGTGKLLLDKDNATPYLTTSGGAHLVAPGDWARIYSTQPLIDAGITGTGLDIAVVGADTDIQLSDVRTFRQVFNLPENDPELIIDGTDPGIVPANSFEVEAALDIEWSGAIAPNAKIKFVTAASTAATFGFDLALAHIIDNRLAPIVTNSIGSCELFLGDAGNNFISSLYQQAVAEGMTIVVAAGDTGAAGCDGQQSFFPASFGPMVNGTASTPYNVAVGGTMFAESGADSTFWNPKDRSDHSSAIGYIPETIWQESCDPTTDAAHCFNTNIYFLSAGGGGPSNCIHSNTSGVKGYTCLSGYAKPSWQAGIGVPSDKVRDLPDISFNAGANHDGYLVCVEGSCQTSTVAGATVITNASVIGGTSAGAPSFAGALALLEQKEQAYLGLINFDLYKLSTAENLSACNSSILIDPTKSNACVFFDVTAGNNNVPGLLGARAVEGFDLASGLGSVNFANLVSKWDSVAKLPSATSLLLTGGVAFQHGQPIPIRVNVAPFSGSGIPQGLFSIVASNGKALFGGSLKNGAFSGNVNGLPAGSYKLNAFYGGDAMFAASESSASSITVSAEASVVSVQPLWINFDGQPTPITQAVNYNEDFGLQIAVSGKSGASKASGTFTLLMDDKQTFGPYSLNAEGNAFVWLSSLDGKGIVPGTHTFVVSYAGDGSFLPAVAPTVTITELKGNVQLETVIAQGSAWVDEDINSLYAGTPLDVSVIMGAPDMAVRGALAPTGVIRIYECPNFDCTNGFPVSGDVPILPNQSPTTTRLSLPAGDHVLVTFYSGDSNYASINFLQRLNPAVEVTLQRNPKVILSLSQALGPIALGSSQKYFITAKSSQSTAPVKGTVFLLDWFGDQVTDGINLVNGSATFSLPQTSAGKHEYWALFYSGGPDPMQFASPGVYTIVNPSSTVAGIGTSTTATVANTKIDLTATVLGAASGRNVTQPGAEGGQVLYYDSLNGGAAQILGGGPQLLTIGNGSNVSINTTPVVLAEGRHVITVKFTGTNDWLSSASTAAVITVSKGAGVQVARQNLQ